jgi:hypothetical protein
MEINPEEIAPPTPTKVLTAEQVRGIVGKVPRGLRNSQSPET